MKVLPGRICGEINIIPSKSHTHRLLICAALSKTSTTIRCPLASDDILHTKNCLNVLCADIEETGNGFLVDPRFPDDAPVLPCGESGSTYRFLLPVAAALGINARFILKGRLPDRPMDALFETLEAHGVSVNGRNTGEVHIAGKLRGGEFHLPGDISSQFVSGLLLAAPLTGEDCAIVLTSPLQSKGYVDMTLEAVRAFGIRAETSRDRIFIPEGKTTFPPAMLPPRAIGPMPPSGCAPRQREETGSASPGCHFHRPRVTKRSLMCCALSMRRWWQRREK